MGGGGGLGGRGGGGSTSTSREWKGLRCVRKSAGSGAACAGYPVGLIVECHRALGPRGEDTLEVDFQGAQTESFPLRTHEAALRLVGGEGTLRIPTAVGQRVCILPYLGQFFTAPKTDAALKYGWGCATPTAKGTVTAIEYDRGRTSNVSVLWDGGPLPGGLSRSGRYSPCELVWLSSHGSLR